MHKGRLVINVGKKLRLLKYKWTVNDFVLTRFHIMNIESEKCRMELVPCSTEETRMCLVMSTPYDFAMYSLEDLSKLRVLYNSPDMDILDIETSPCQKIMITQGQQMLMVWDAETGNICY